MTWRTSTPILFLRNAGRRVGLNRYFARVLHGSGYETGYDTAFQELLKEGDCVWDVGANVGYYTKMFAKRVGGLGRVFAFEPSPVNYSKLVDACRDLQNVELRPYGLGETDGEVNFQQGTDELGATSRVVDESTGGAGAVQIRAADKLLSEGDAEMPNAIKIDVEGFESEVMKGLGAVLKSSNLRVIGIEMHFGILHGRGMPGAPRAIEAVLRDSGFSISWPDSSHLLGMRK
jgi:FkbM family methyltransferase